MQILAVITAICGIIALSKVNIDLVRAEIEVVTARPELVKYAIYTYTLVCGSLFLLTCAGTLLYEIIIVIVSIVSKDRNTKVLSIVVSNATINPSLCTHAFNIKINIRDSSCFAGYCAWFNCCRGILRPFHCLN